ncbi:hypothetical protein C7974DRAFT_169506 [Boeremia exigua]|uniref:uncharacterized protein n=1 Tax=Boeremia exigua TaxID=749465 RepID=UPI001E8E3F5F|nr:uncharacterized protein C7974DRAFT_169506 [Boeremia exigua]KAH6633330.1 hypothetical protein C7974DRAFT_169506 [Boeremia exigua]
MSIACRSRVIALGLCFFQLYGNVNGDCYARNGESALDSSSYPGKDELVTCGQETSSCCFRGELCASNLLCYGPNRENVARQWCDNRSWKNCSDFANDHTRGGVGLTDCGSNEFAIGTEPGNCGTQILYFVDPHTGEVHNTSTRSSKETPRFWTVDSESALGRTTSSPISIIYSTTSVTKVDTTPSVVVLSTPTAMPSSETSPPPRLSAGAGAGIGIGCSAGVAGIILSTWLWRRERKKRKELQHQVDHQVHPPIYEPESTSKAVYARTYVQETNRELPPQELEGTPWNEVP